MVNNLRQAAEQVLNTLNFLKRGMGSGHIKCSTFVVHSPDATEAEVKHPVELVNNDIAALRAALAEQPAEQEPFGYLWPTGTHPEFRFTQQERNGVDGMPVYTAPQPAKPAEQEPYTFTPQATGVSIYQDKIDALLKGKPGQTAIECSTNAGAKRLSHAVQRTIDRLGKKDKLQVTTKQMDGVTLVWVIERAR